MVAGKDYDCLPGLGVEPVHLGTGGDVFYFPKSEDPEVTKASGHGLDDGDQGSSGCLQPEEGLAADAG